ncbi:phage tail protein I [Cellulosilyticum sp. WCF-2]|uniref:phage tail protein I n=1 Tax=Cellulosilyticum sp. WCF-2 TaxID=2497860 RepID=UPI000F8DABAF|nr:phage tail protein I [Cellulosilyticum sp. WCF-2]QEH67254.1 phage tail protein I [Cellulosilyticum sp. WCF-2]
MNNINQTSIMDLLPPSIASDSKIINAAKALDKEIAKVNELMEKTIILPYIDKLGLELVDILAEQFKAPFYDSSLSIEKKRELVKKSIAWHNRKGTVGALEEVVTTIFGESEVSEWYEYGGEPHHFRITTTNLEVDNELIQQFKETAEHIKRKSSKLDEVIVNIASQLDIFTGFAIHQVDKIIVRQEG